MVKNKDYIGLKNKFRNKLFLLKYSKNGNAFYVLDYNNNKFNIKSKKEPECHNESKPWPNELNNIGVNANDNWGDGSHHRWLSYDEIKKFRELNVTKKTSNKDYNLFPGMLSVIELIKKKNYWDKDIKNFPDF